MRSGVIAQKVGMTRVFTDGGEHVPVTVMRLARTVCRLGSVSVSTPLSKRASAPSSVTSTGSSKLRP